MLLILATFLLARSRGELLLLLLLIEETKALVAFFIYIEKCVM